MQEMKDGKWQRKIWGEPDVIPTREELREYIVENMFGKRRIHLIAGPSTSGKSRLALPMLWNIAHGETFFGHKTNPEKFIYYVAERGYEDVYEVSYDLKIPTPEESNFLWKIFDPWKDEQTAAQMRSLQKLKGNAWLPWVVDNYIAPQWPEHKLLFIDGMSGILRGAENDYDAVSEMMQEFRMVIRKHKITIIGAVHTTKSRKDQYYELTREKIMGSNAWGGYSDTVMMFNFHNREKMSVDPRRILEISKRNSAGELLHLTFYEKDDPRQDGGLHLVPDYELKNDKGKTSRARLVRDFLDTSTSPTFTTKELDDYLINRMGYSHGLAHNALDDALKFKMIERFGHGKYRVIDSDDAFDLTRPEDTLPQPGWAKKENVEA